MAFTQDLLDEIEYEDLFNKEQIEITLENQIQNEVEEELQNSIQEELTG